MVLNGNPYRILLVEDTSDHATLVRIAFAEVDPDARIRVAPTAEAAITFLQACRLDADRWEPEFPDVILLDIHMPGMGGLSFLKWYSDQEDLAGIPVLIFTATGDPATIQACMDLGAHRYLRKPADFTELVPVVQQLVGRDRTSGSMDSAG